MTNLICISILLLILGWACRYLYKSKKQGVKCIGCPSGASCSCSSGKGASNGNMELIPMAKSEENTTPADGMHCPHCECKKESCSNA